MVASLGIVLDRISRSRLAGDPPDVQIAPKIGHIGFTEFDRAPEMIHLGRLATEAVIPELLDTLTLAEAKTEARYRAAVRTKRAPIDKDGSKATGKEGRGKSGSADGPGKRKRRSSRRSSKDAA